MLKANVEKPSYYHGDARNASTETGVQVRHPEIYEETAIKTYYMILTWSG